MCISLPSGCRNSSPRDLGDWGDTTAAGVDWAGQKIAGLQERISFNTHEANSHAARLLIARYSPGLLLHRRLIPTRAFAIVAAYIISTALNNFDALFNHF